MASLTLDWIQLAAILGALQGVFLTGVLLSQRNNRTANRLLAALMAAFTVYLGSSAYSAGLMRALPHTFGVAYLTPWLFGPLVYLYAVAASDRSWRFTPRALLHFLPVAIIVIVNARYYLMSGAEKLALYERMVVGDVPARIAALDPSKYVSGIGYSIATVLYLRRHRRRIEDSYSNTARVNLKWLLWLAAAAAGIWLLATTLRITDLGDRLHDEQVSLAIAILVYAIGYLGLRQPEVFRYETAEFAVPNKPVGGVIALMPAESEPPAAATAPSARYERSGLDDRQAQKLKDALMRVMDVEQPWKDSELTLADLAARLDTTPHKLSEVLNSEIGETFYDFVNGYRVREVQRRIRAGEARTLKMLALALDAGFASKSTFNQAFKKHTTQTPSDFRQAVGA
jgi:AraC-like DNA-binding protein